MINLNEKKDDIHEENREVRVFIQRVFIATAIDDNIEGSKTLT